MMMMGGLILVSFLDVCMYPGFSTCRFNFRGVSGSSGRATWRGGGEKDDMRAVCSYMMALDPPPKGVVILGYSYGSVIGSAVGGAMPEVRGWSSDDGWQEEEKELQ